MYQTVLSPIIGKENLECRHEEKNEEDDFAIGVYRNYFQKGTLVGNMPRNISKFVYKFKRFFLLSEKKEIKQRCWIWIGNT